MPRTIYVPQAAICVTGGIQPGILQRALGTEHRESGLAARLLLACPPRKAKKWTEADIDPRAEAELAALFDRLHEMQPHQDDDGESRPVLVKLDAQAKVAWTEYYDTHAVEQAELAGDLSAAWSKLEEYAARLALVLHFVRWAAHDPKLGTAGFVDAESMNGGITLANWFKHEARRVYGILDESEAERNQRRLVEWIERRGGSASPRDVQQGCRWLKSKGDADEALEGLAKAGLGHWNATGSSAGGGRPSRILVLSTSSTVYETPTTEGANEGFVDVDGVDSRTEREPDAFPFGFNNLGDPDGERLFPLHRGLPD